MADQRADDRGLDIPPFNPKWKVWNMQRRNEDHQLHIRVHRDQENTGASETELGVGQNSGRCQIAVKPVAEEVCAKICSIDRVALSAATPHSNRKE